MPAVPADKIASSDLEQARYIFDKKFHLDQRQMDEFYAASPDTVFGLWFIRGVLADDPSRTVEMMKASCERAAHALKLGDVKSIKELSEMTIHEVAKLRGMGARSLGLVLDVLMAFGIELKDEWRDNPEQRDTFAVNMQRGRALLDALNIPQPEPNRR